MKRTQLALLIAAAVATPILIGWQAGPYLTDGLVKLLATGDSTDFRIERAIPSCSNGKPFFGAVLAARRDEVIVNRAYGFADAESKVLNTTATRFQIGQLTRQFIAASVLLLAERGQLRIDDSVVKYIPGAPSAWNGITIYDLLIHNSRLPYYISLPEYETIKGVASPLETTIALFRDKPLLRTSANERLQFGNSGYILLGYLIERISGGSYEQFLRQNIFVPLEMYDTGLYDGDSLYRGAAGHRLADNVISRSNEEHILYSDGGLYSTVKDLLRWQRGLFNGKLLTAESIRTMTEPPRNINAAGLTVHEIEGQRAIDFAGAIPGYTSYMAYFPDEDVIIIVLTNMNPGSLAGCVVYTIAGEILS